MDIVQPVLNVFNKEQSKQTMTVPPTSGSEVNRFTWLVFRPQSYAMKPFESDTSARQERYVNSPQAFAK